jgi:hypothetical protein
MDAVTTTVIIVKIVKNKKNPRLKNITLPLLLFSIEWLINTGIIGSTHGEIKEATPAKNERKKPVSTLSHTKSDLKAHLEIDILQFCLPHVLQHLKLVWFGDYRLYKLK